MKARLTRSRQSAPQAHTLVCHADSATSTARLRAAHVLSFSVKRKNWTNTRKRRIFPSYFNILLLNVTIMSLAALKDTFTKTRLLNAAKVAVVALPAAFMAVSAPANDAYAGQAQTTTLTPGERGLDAVQGRRVMRHYSQDAGVQGIGVFINLQADAAGKGELLGNRLVEMLANKNPPVSAEYRINQSRGTATDITFYVRGIDFTVNLGDLRDNLDTVLAHHRGAWLPEQTAGLSTPAATRQ